MAIQNISGADSIANSFSVNTTEALRKAEENNSDIKKETISKQIREQVNDLKDMTKGTKIDILA